ncbi:hypothetical protein BUZ46_11160 [Staphylococcus hominis]|uniref:hypothetical protein n=1 Tax=Staphylococcus hominis TaxID=1290 RepID=UPI000D1F8A7A|nr:hypothetical protein [Staphylococcus hominis]PTK35660.1 hypothetical protein BUZ46_11160 [Staphylococcus hominis]RIO50926.1 hypothetical protein BUZ55_02035 [Staphylococcus hominis]
MKKSKYFLLLPLLHIFYTRLIDVRNKNLVDNVNIESEEDFLLQKNLYRDSEGKIREFIDY